jgi:1-deoxy-D-xylulose-5-phosphate synthase
LARTARVVVTIEDGVVVGGVGSRVAQALRAAGVDVPTREIGVPAQFLDHGSVPDVRARIGMTGQDIARRVVEWAAGVVGGNGGGGDATGAVAETDADSPPAQDVRAENNPD